MNILPKDQAKVAFSRLKIAELLAIKTKEVVGTIATLAKA